ncbi:hypothetical protein SRHO_G00253830 [Serrasalmus rhombeus]
MKVQQRMYLLHQPRNYSRAQELLVQFCTAIVEAVIIPSITVHSCFATRHDSASSDNAIIRKLLLTHHTLIC